MADQGDKRPWVPQLIQGPEVEGALESGRLRHCIASLMVMV